MAFNDDLAEEGKGLVWLLDVSFDDFATISYRWSTASARISGQEYDGRIASLTPIMRGFGRDHLPAATTTKVRIENSDFGADWMLDRSTVATQLLQSRFRLTAFIYDAAAYRTAADSLSGTSQVLGIFNCLEQPEMMDNAIDVTLADDSLGRLAEPLTTPTVRDWFDAATLINFDTGSPVAGMDWDVPLPIVLGAGEYGVQVPAYKAIDAYLEHPGPVPSVASAMSKRVEDGRNALRTFPIIVCASRSGNYFGSTEITRLHGTYREDVVGRPEFRNVTVEIPRSYTVDGVYTFEIWKPQRSLNITKAGRTWQIVYVDFNVDLYTVWFNNNFPNIRVAPGGGGGQIANTNDWYPSTIDGAEGQTTRSFLLGAFASFHCNGTPLSVMTTRPVPTAEDTTGASRLLTDFIYDAIAFYSNASPADMDGDAFARAAKARATVFGAGIIQPSRPRPLASTQRYGWVSPNPRDGIIGVLRAALGEMCGSCDVDLFMTKEGLYSVSTNVFDFEAVTGERTAVVESRTQRVRIRTPSQGERWAPYNRVNLIGPGGASFGPYDNQDAIDEWGIVLPVTLQAKWDARLWSEGAATGASTVWNYRTLESKVRPAVRFLAGREYLALELGDYFDFTYSRGGQSYVYNGVVFRVEAMRINPTTLSVEFDAVWSNDLVDDSPYLLDDEDFLLRVESAGGRTATVVDSSAVVQFSSGDLVADGVEAGDVLVLKDSTQDADVFTRYRKILIASVDDTDLLTLDTSDLDFDAPGGGAAVADWYIERGATTYHDSVSDPTNYPSDGDMYGKACGDADTFSDSSAANKLMDG